jgi:3-hydroxyisobutyrate dehydrogenase-like beta-hydroxyacid dehydrogenase
MQQDVAVFGLGHMGAALARLFLKGGFSTTVWNRSMEKAAPLVEAGATAAADPASAVGGAAVALFCLDRYENVQGLLEQADAAGTLAGRTVVNLTWGTPEEARALSRWLEERGVGYLDGNVYDYPSNVGPESEAVSYAGDRAVFDAHLHLLSALSLPQHEGADPALPNILGSAGSVVHHVALAGFYEAAAYAAHYGVDAGTVLDFHERHGVELTSYASRVAVEKLASGDFTSDQAALRTHLDALLVNQADMHRIGQPAPMLSAFVDLLEEVADEKGHLALAAAAERFGRRQAPDEAPASTD